MAKEKIEFPPENEIPKSHPFDLCMYFSDGNKLLGYFTYLSYKDYKLEWIKNYKKSNGGKEPTNKRLEKFKMELHEKDYQSFIMNAEQKVNKYFSQLVESEIQNRLPKEVANSNLKNLFAKIDKKNSFVRSVFASAVGSFGLIVLFLVLSWAFNTGLFDKVYALIVPNLPPASN